MEAMTNSGISGYQGLQSYILTPLLPYTQLFLDMHFTALSLLLQVLIAAFSLDFLPLSDVAASMWLLYVFNLTIPFALSFILPYLFPAELYKNEIDALVFAYNAAAYVITPFVESLEQLIWHICHGYDQLCYGFLEAVQDIQWLCGGINGVSQQFDNNAVKTEYNRAEDVAAVEVTAPIEPDSEPRVAEVQRLVIEEYLSPRRYPSPFKTQLKSTWSGRQTSELYRKSSEYFEDRDSKSAENRASARRKLNANIWKIQPVPRTVVVAAKPIAIIDPVDGRSMIKRTGIVTWRERRLKTHKCQEELAANIKNTASKANEYLELNAEAHTVNNTPTTTGYVLPGSSQEEKCANDKETKETLKDVKVEDRNEKGKRVIVELANHKEEEAVLTGITMDFQKTETLSNTPLVEISETAITEGCNTAPKVDGNYATLEGEASTTNEGRTEATECTITHGTTLEKVARVTKQDLEIEIEGNIVPASSPASETLGSRNDGPGFDTIKGLLPSVIGVIELTDPENVKVFEAVKALETVKAVGFIKLTTAAPKDRLIPTPQIVENSDRESIKEIVNCPDPVITGPIPDIEAPTYTVCEIKEGPQPMLVPESTGTSYLPVFNHSAQTQNDFLYSPILCQKNLGRMALDIPQWKQQDLEVPRVSKDEEMVDEIYEQAIVGDEEMQDALRSPQTAKEQNEVAMDDIPHIIETLEPQEMEIEPAESEVDSSQEMELEATGLETNSVYGQEMDLELTGHTSVQDMEIEGTGTEVAPVQSVGPENSLPQSFPIFEPAPIFSPMVINVLPASEVISDLASESIVNASSSPAPPSPVSPASSPTHIYIQLDPIPPLDLAASDPPSATINLPSQSPAISELPPAPITDLVPSKSPPPAKSTRTLTRKPYPEISTSSESHSRYPEISAPSKSHSYTYQGNSSSSSTEKSSTLIKGPGTAKSTIPYIVTPQTQNETAAIRLNDSTSSRTQTPFPEKKYRTATSGTESYQIETVPGADSRISDSIFRQSLFPDKKYRKATPGTQRYEIETAANNSQFMFPEKKYRAAIPGTQRYQDEAKAAIGVGISSSTSQFLLPERNHQIGSLSTPKNRIPERNNDIAAAVEAKNAILSKNLAELVMANMQAHFPEKKYPASPSPRDYSPTRHVETSTASSSRISTPKRAWESGYNPDTPTRGKDLRLIAPIIKKSINPIGVTKPIETSYEHTNATPVKRYAPQMLAKGIYRDFNRASDDENNKGKGKEKANDKTENEPNPDHPSKRHMS